eukprot:UN24687
MTKSVHHIGVDVDHQGTTWCYEVIDVITDFALQTHPLCRTGNCEQEVIYKRAVNIFRKDYGISNLIDMQSKHHEYVNVHNHYNLDKIGTYKLEPKSFPCVVFSNLPKVHTCMFDCDTTDNEIASATQTDV